MRSTRLEEPFTTCSTSCVSVTGTSSKPLAVWADSSRSSRSSVVSAGIGCPVSSTSQIRSPAMSSSTPSAAPTARTICAVSASDCSCVLVGRSPTSTGAFIEISSTPRSPIMFGTTSEAGECA